MKRFFAILLCCIIVMNAIPVCSAEGFKNTSSTMTDHGNGITSISEIVIELSQARSAEKTATRKETFYLDDEIIAVIAFQATFSYDGNSVTTISKNITQTDTYSGWSFTQNSFSSNGGTVTLNGKLVRWLIFKPTTFTMSMTCDKDGNITIS